MNAGHQMEKRWQLQKEADRAQIPEEKHGETKYGEQICTPMTSTLIYKPASLQTNVMTACHLNLTSIVKQQSTISSDCITHAQVSN